MLNEGPKPKYLLDSELFPAYKHGSSGTLWICLGLWCFRNNCVLDITILRCTAQMINVGIKRNGNIDWCLSLVYASPVVAVRDYFYEFIEGMS